MQTYMEFAFVAAVRHVGLKDVAVAGFELFQDGGFVDDAGSAVIGECAEKNLSKPQHYPKNTVFYSVNHSVIG